MASSVWTATVWGNGKAAIIAASNRKIRPGEEECFICKDDVPASVALRPCGHKICFGCVENLRAKNIFRADKGVKCPFCRQYVEQYDPCNSADPEQVRLLNEANRAAAFAQASRAPGSAQTGSGGGGGAGTGGPAVDDNWMCGTCRCLNLPHRDECGSCGRPNPRGPRPTISSGSSRGKDVLKCSDDEVIGFMQEKQQPNLQRCYQEIGIGFGAGRVVSDDDTPRRIVNAFKQHGEERMLRLINVVSDPAVFRECSTHFFGNYGMQSLVEATLLIRKALAEAEAEGQYPLQSFRDSHDGRDPHGVLLYAALSHAVELATDERANYIVQKLADYATPEELVDMCGTLFPQGPALAQNNKGVFVMNKLITKLRDVCSDSAYRIEQCELADKLCCTFIEQPDKLKYALHNGLSSRVLVTAIGLGLPRYGAVQLGSRVASYAAQLTASKNGHQAVIAMLEMEPADATCAELVRDLVVMVGLKLQGGLVGLLLRRTMPDDRGPTLVRLLLRRLAEHQETGWLDAICQELVNYGDVIAESEEACEILKEALCHSVLDDDTVLEHLLQLRHVITNEATMAAIEDDVCGRRDAASPPPPPRYYAPSVLLPDLKYRLASGEVVLMTAPPPPHKPNGFDSYAGGAANGQHGAGGYGHGGRGGGRYGGRGGRGGRFGGRGQHHHHPQHQHQTHSTPTAPATFDASYFAEGLFDPAAPVQASSGVDAWAAAAGGADPWATSTTADGWAAAPEPASTQRQQQAPAADHPGHKAGLAIMQSLQAHQHQHSHAPAGAAPATSALAHAQPHYQPHPQLPAHQQQQQQQPTMVTPMVVSAAPAATHAAPAVAPAAAAARPHPLLAVNPALAAARALHQQAHVPANGPAAPGQPQAQVQPHVVTPQVVTPQVVQVSPQVQYQQAQYAPTAVAPPAAALPRPSHLGFPMALFNPAMAVLNNTAGIAAFAPRGPHAATTMAAPRPVTAIPVTAPMPQPAMAAPVQHQMPVAVPLTSMPQPQPSAAPAASARPVPVIGQIAAASSSSAAMAAAAAAANRPAPRAAVQPQAPPPQPTAGAPGGGGPWQCKICTYEHKGGEAQFLACAICGCERGMQELPS
ncbi:hypothetical protein HYH02_006156 [Chlamydomonas schloesseri]|uniref:RanBP-type and C3HC4-type zinc finger-containing protein 1 n=1 Tax=Chlamydomonas schloesseri TaxID=2026947 RepID=A0A836B6B3_9CHLO|nr:hypothetical protein HYH02_006156 [Chlamydomonas schloesseri]|eukprot:KAG2448805.1 hypothetical protein HYH02_006156 [Chlamydomonas schloesseri]